MLLGQTGSRWHLHLFYQSLVLPVGGLITPRKKFKLTFHVYASVVCQNICSSKAAWFPADSVSTVLGKANASTPRSLMHAIFVAKIVSTCYSLRSWKRGKTLIDLYVFSSAFTGLCAVLFVLSVPYQKQWSVPPVRGVTRFDGARGKKQVWRPHVRNWVLPEANVLSWRKYLCQC